jgi:hypothetical protein
MKQVEVNVFETEGYAVTVEVEGDVKEYAENFLHIFNNVRESEELFKAKNYYGSNDVTVYCELEAKDKLIKYLNAFGKIKGCEKVLLLKMEEPEYDIDKYYDIVVVPDFD